MIRRNPNEDLRAAQSTTPDKTLEEPIPILRDFLIAHRHDDMLAELDSLTAQLEETTKAYETVKAWAHCVSSHLETIMARCDDHADGTSDATELEKFCNEMIGLSNSISLSDVRTLRAQLEETRKHLLTYGAHTPVCRGADNCDCGFSEVQKGLPATPDFLALLKQVSDRALDNMEGEDAEGFNRWEKVHTTAEDLIRAIALAEGRKT